MDPQDLMRPLDKALENMERSRWQGRANEPIVHAIMCEIVDILRKAPREGQSTAFPNIEGLVYLLRVLVVADDPLAVSSFLEEQLRQIAITMQKLKMESNNDSAQACWALGCVVARALENFSRDRGHPFQIVPDIFRRRLSKAS